MVMLAEPEDFDTESEIEDEEGTLSGKLAIQGFPEIRKPLKKQEEKRLELGTDYVISPD